ncbi:hypothetical protein [Nostoc sp. C052]|uniref:hypothetical protein n=1 Tax=Nostoc sp. C052 TaxID=2576902 RepID=UPI0021175B55|nr:hypothetical protein [Nostoc sp. C052]
MLRQKQGTYIRQENQPYQRLQSLELTPGISFFFQGIAVVAPGVSHTISTPNCRSNAIGLGLKAMDLET